MWEVGPRRIRLLSPDALDALLSALLSRKSVASKASTDGGYPFDIL